MDNILLHARCRSKRLSRESGQALVEYILVLFVIVIVASFFLQFSTAFRGYVDNYVGEYVACLLETGELPSLGNDAPQAGSICESQFEPFSLASGRAPRVGSGGGGGLSGDNPAGGGSLGDTSDGSGGSSGRSRRVGGGGSQGIRNGGPGGGRSSQVNAGADTGAGGAGAGSSGEASGGTYIVGGGGRSKRVPYRGISGRLIIEDEDEENAKPRVVARGASVSRASEEGGRPPKIPIKPPEKKEEKQKEGGGFTIGGFFKYLLIAAIVIALLVFLGGQVAQVAKGWEK